MKNSIKNKIRNSEIKAAVLIIAVLGLSALPVNRYDFSCNMPDGTIYEYRDGKNILKIIKNF